MKPESYTPGSFSLFFFWLFSLFFSPRNAAQEAEVEGDATFVCATSRDLVRHELNASSADPRFRALLLQRHPNVGGAEGAV